jgi:hypothetical protein
MTHISTTQWVSGLGWVDTAYITEVLPDFPDQNYIIAFQRMAVTTISISL